MRLKYWRSRFISFEVLQRMVGAEIDTESLLFHFEAFKHYAANVQWRPKITNRLNLLSFGSVVICAMATFHR